VDEQVVMSAQQHSVRKIGAAAVAPGHDVMHLAPGGWSIAPREQASTISRRKPDPLAGGIQPLFAADVDDPSTGIEDHRHDSGVAGMPLHRGDADRGGLTLELAGARASSQIALCDQYPNCRAPRGQHRGVAIAAETDQFHESV